MAISIKTVGRSILESMLFLAVIAFGSVVFSKLKVIAQGFELSPFVYLPFMAVAASSVVALVFPKPTYWRAFFKFLLGALLTFGIFAVLMAILGSTVFTAILDALWNLGGVIWDWSSVDNVVLGFFAVLFYIFFAVLVFGMLLAGLFAITNFLVLLGINVFLDRNKATTEPVRSQDDL